MSINSVYKQQMDVPIFTSYCAVFMITFLYGRFLQNPISKNLPSTNHTLTRFHFHFSISILYPRHPCRPFVSSRSRLASWILDVRLAILLAIDKYFSSLPFSFSFRISTSLSTDYPRRAPRCCSTCSTTTSTFSEC